MENELKAIVTADISNFTAGMAKVASNLERAEGLFKKASRNVFALENSIASLSAEYKAGAISEAKFLKETERLNKELEIQRKDVSASALEVNRLKKALESTGAKKATDSISSLSGSTKTLGKDIKGANTVALEFNRIIQDAPFGIMGVGNNIQQLTANFSNLSKNAGGSGKALKAAFSALVTGPNVALLAISALTTGLTLLQSGFFDTEEKAKSLAEELEGYRETLDQVNRAMVEGASNGDKEAQSFNNLRLQAENANIPLDKRLEAVKELQQKYPDYLGNLTQEEILTGNVGGAYESLTKSIIASAKAKAFSNEISENSLKLRTLELQAEENVNKIYEQREKIQKVIENDRQTSALKIAGQTTAQNNDLVNANKELDSLIKNQFSTLEDINKLRSDNLGLEQEITKQLEQGATFTATVKTGGGEGKEKALADYDSEKFIEELNSNLKKDYKDALGRLSDELTDSEFKEIPINLDFQTEKVSEETQAVIENMILIGDEVNRLEESFNKVLENNAMGLLTKTAGDFGSQLASTFSSGNTVVDNFVKNVIKSVPQVISAFQKLQTARKAQALASQASDLQEATSGSIVLGVKAANALGPVGLALLPVLIAGAVAIVSSAFGKGGGSGASVSQSSQTYGNIPGRQFGGSVQKGQQYIVGEKRPELFIPTTNGTIIPQIPTTSQMSGNTSGSNQMKIQVEVIGQIENEVIRLANKRGTDRANNT